MNGLKVGDAIITDHGSAYVVDTRDGGDGQKVAFVVDGHLVWREAIDVVRMDQG